MIQINSTFMKKDKWEATVNKMRKVMGAPIQEEDVAIIVKYLTQNYGVEWANKHRIRQQPTFEMS